MCKLICNDCEACLHKYSCEYLDNAIQFNMCKHIHEVCQFVKNQTVVVRNVQNPLPAVINENLFETMEEINVNLDGETNPF